MRLPIFHVDAFASELFAGNPAAVVPLRDWLPDGVLQAIAAENALPETAFLVPGAEGWDLRWFTPTVEVDLCGHATLASAFVLAATTEPGTDRFVFATREAGTLVVTREGGRFTIDLPSRPARPVPADREVLDALGVA
ncbi:MAG TPA: PhzF family phenazine biosynthesis isomerase, partial [Arenibaculum sp.]|nr:PhzF family phenazine biosynthesis isomerase [Arenibaculum sp.]